MQANRELITDINNLRTDRDKKLSKFKEAGGEKALNFYREKERKWRDGERERERKG